MPTITFTVRGKIATAAAGASIVCGNGGYVVSFDFDEEWSEYSIKTARFNYVRDGVRLYQDVQFIGSTVAVPVMYDVTAVTIGCYAGNLISTTGAVVPCTRSATDGDAVHPDPAPDIYAQLLEYLENLPRGGAATGDAYTVLSGGIAETITGIAETEEEA